MSPDMIPAEVTNVNAVIQTRPEGNGFDLEKHPLTLLASLAPGLRIKAFTLRTYEESEYGQGFRDIASYRVPAENIVERGLELMAEAEEAGYDLVVDSLVILEDGTTEKRHLAFIDFLVKAEDVPLDSLVGGLAVNGDGNSFEDLEGVNPETQMVFFTSGRSYHGYVTSTTFNLEELRQFMATLLIIKPLGNLDIVDHRWVGRRLLAGTGALRLSKTSERYLAFPQRVEQTPPF